MAKVKTVEERNKELALIGKKLRHYGLRLRLDSTKSQSVYFDQTIGSSRFTFNFYLNEKQEVYKTTGESLSYNTFKKSFNGLKTHPMFNWLTKADKFALENAMMDVDDAFKNFFSGKAKYPRFKRKHGSKQSYTTNFTNNNIKLNVEKKTVQLPKAGEVSFRMSKKQQKELMNGKREKRILSATVSKHSNGTYYVSIKFEEIIDIKVKKDIEHISDDEVIAGDLGLSHFIILSDGTKIENPRYYRSCQKHLAKMQRRLSKMKKGSYNYFKQKKKIAKFHTHIKNMRHDFLHKISRKLVDENQVIILEDLNVKGMIKNRKLSKSIQDVGWGYFKQFVQYKAEWANKYVVLVNTFFPSSKICNGCKEKNTLLSLNDRTWVCPSCGCEHDRDKNAAKNIKEEGLKILRNELLTTV